MAQSPIAKSATINNAAKDDVVGLNGDYSFTISDLLANDPGGAAKNDVTKQFFFGSIGDYTTDQIVNGIPTIDAQKDYLAAHHISYNETFTEFTINHDSTDIQYMVQMGNKGTWSLADVDVNVPAIEPHAGNLLFSENFDSYSGEDHGSWSGVNLGVGGWANTEGTGAYGEVVRTDAATSGHQWLDTQNSPGGTNIANWFHDDTGGAFLLQFDLGVHDFGDGPMQETAHDAEFQVLIDNKVVKTLHWSDFDTPGKMEHFSIVVDAGNGDASGNHGISFVDTTASQGNYVGFMLDSIQVNDWVVA